MRPDRGRRRPARSPPARRCRGRRGGSARVPARRLPRDRTARGRSTCSRSHVGAPRVRAREDPTQPAQAPRRELAEHLAVQERRSRDAVHADHCIAVALLAYEAADPGGPELALGDARRSRRDCSSAPIITAPVRVRLRAVIQLAGLALAVGSTFAVGLLIGPRSTDDLRATVDALGPASPLLFVGLATLLACALFPYPVLAAASGLLFGTGWGTVLATVAGTTGAVAAFGIARAWGAASVDQLAGARARWRDGHRYRTARLRVCGARRRVRRQPTRLTRGARSDRPADRDGTSRSVARVSRSRATR